MAAAGESVMQKTFLIIEYMSQKRCKVSLQGVADELSLPVATVRRLLNSLTDMGYVAQDANKQYCLTYKMYKVAGKSINRNGFLQKLIPYMNYFALRYQGEVGLTVFDNGEIVHIVNVGHNNNFSGSSMPRPGQVFPTYCSAAGKVFLAQMEDQELKSWLKEGVFLPYTPFTIIDKQQIFQIIQETRRRGCGFSVREIYENVCAVAFPIHDQGGNVIGTFNFRMLSETYQKRMEDGFVDRVQAELKNFGL